MSKPVPVWWHSRTQWPETEGVIGGRFWKPGCKGFDGLLYEKTHEAEPLYSQEVIDQLIDERDVAIKQTRKGRSR